MIEGVTSRSYAIINILQVANIAGGVRRTKIIEMADLNMTEDLLIKCLSVLEHYDFLSFQKGEQVYRTTYKGMRFLLAYNRAFELITNIEKANQTALPLNKT
jgi:predicted transcriptional regulator